MTKILLSTTMLAGLLIAGAAQAADMPIKAQPRAPEYFSWTGFYIGGHVGGTWGTIESALVDHSASLPISSHTINGFVAGGQAGYNFQVNPWLVFGIEGQISWTDASGRTPCAPLSILGCSTDVNWVATLAGRVGFTRGHTMLYVKGGVAWADTDYHVDFLGTNFLNASNTRTGAMVGAGVEHAFAPNWSAKIEYNFMDFDTDNLGFGFSGKCGSNMDSTVAVQVCRTGINADVTQKMHLIKFGLNYRFWGGGQY
jgi:outer membrane immunogenic protein